jgi:hypothetical protein
VAEFWNPAGDFNRDASTADGLQRRCRDCERRYRQTNRKAIAVRRRYRLAEPGSDHRPGTAAVTRPTGKRSSRSTAATGEIGRRPSGKRSAPGSGQRYAAIKAQAFGHYGWVCVCCGATKGLSIDHINGGGARFYRLRRCHHSSSFASGSIHGRHHHGRST